VTLSPTAPQAALPPDCAAKFAVEGLIASGGFGIVYRARQIALDRTVAVKLLLDHALSSEVTVGRFMNEARATASIEHANVIRVIDHGAENEIPWIAYEYLPGRNLRQILDAGPIPLERTLLIAQQVADALEVAHQKGILHRDIKPDNVIEAEPELFKVADFGIARFSKGSSVHTQTGTFVGTVGYVAPEIIIGEEPGGRADLYALGAMLFEMATGVLPFADDNPIKALSRHVSETPPSPRERRPELSPALDSLILRLLSKKPADRPGTAAEVSQALGHLRAGRAVEEPAVDITRAGSRPSRSMRPMSRVSRVGSRSRPDSMRSIAASEVAPPERRRVLTVALAIGIAAGIAGILAWRADTPARTDGTGGTAAPASTPGTGSTDARSALVGLVTGPARYDGSAEAAMKRVEALRAALAACVARVRAAPAGPEHRRDRAAGLALAYALRIESRLAGDLGARPGDDSERTASALTVLIPGQLVSGTAEDGRAAEDALAALAKVLRTTKISANLPKAIAECLARLRPHGAGLRWAGNAPQVKTLDYISDIARQYRRSTAAQAAVEALRPLGAWFEGLEAHTDDPAYWGQRTEFLRQLGRAEVPPEVPVRWAAALLVRHARQKGKLDAETASELARALEGLRETLHEPPFEGLMRDFERREPENGMGGRRGSHFVGQTEYFSAARTLRTKPRAGAWPLGAPLGLALADVAVRAAAGAPAAPVADLTARAGNWCPAELLVRAFELSVLTHGGEDADRERLKRLMDPYLKDALARTIMWRAPIEHRGWLEMMYPHRAMPETIALIEPDLREIRTKLGW
jgi:hypothetical protein